MVFSNLQAHEKEGFFSLLDEYFQSRPEIFANLSDGSRMVSPAAMNRASDVTSKVVSAGLRHAASRPGGTTPSESDVSSVANRVAAFSLQRNSHLSSPASSANSASPASALKKMGDIDTSSAKNFFGSLRNANNSNPASNVPPPPTQQQSNFGAPPVRRVVSNASPRVAVPDPPPTTRPQEEEEEEEKVGDWADVIYDYDSGEAGDLKITEGDVVLIIDRTSDDWWTGEVNGKKGLFPASYVKLR